MTQRFVHLSTRRSIYPLKTTYFLALSCFKTLKQTGLWENRNNVSSVYIILQKIGDYPSGTSTNLLVKTGKQTASSAGIKVPTF